ncbi:MAG: GAF domain-containing protein, partial [Blastochloris sp.]|nr:GAF domain-containing protein [Blastochloris sp.]
MAVQENHHREQNGNLEALLAHLQQEFGIGPHELEAALRRNKELSNALDEHSIVAITDQRGVIQFVNDKFVEISGYSREELIGQDHRIINSGYHDKEFIRDMWVTIANGKVWKGELRNRRKNGTFYWVDTTIVPFLNEEGKPYQYIAIRTDITAQKQQAEALHRNQQLYSEMARNFPNGAIAVYDHNLRYLVIDGQGLTEVGLDKELMEGKTIWEVFPAETVSAIEGNFRSSLAGNTSVNTVEFAGNFFRTFNLPVRDENGNVIAGMVMTQNVTEQLASAQQLERRAAELATVAEVGAAITTVLDMNDLLQTVVDLTKQRFDLYHAHIYLINGNNLVLTAGAGDAGRRMKQQGHTIPLNREHSLVAKAARTRSGVISNNVREEPDFLANPLLPDTQSELATPILLHDQIIGVLDVQSGQTDRFIDDDILILRTLASQVAVAVQNARSFEAQSIVQRESEQLYRVSEAINTSTNLNEMTDAVSNYINLRAESITVALFENYNIKGATFFDTAAVAYTATEGVQRMGQRFPLSAFPAAEFFASHDLFIVTDMDDRTQIDEQTGESLKQLGYRSFISVALQTNDRVAGTLNFFNSQPRRFNEAEIRLAVAVGGLLSAAFERQRLFQETEVQREDAQFLYQLSTIATSVTNEQQLVEAIARHLPRSAGRHFNICVFEGRDVETAGSFTILGSTDPSPESAMLVGTPLPMSFFPLAKLVRPDSLLIITDGETDPTVDAASREALRQTNVRGFIVAPLMIEGRVMGTLAAVSEQPYAPDDREQHLLRQLASQVTTAVERLRFARAAQKYIDELQIVADISTAVSSVLRLDDLLPQVVELVRSRFDLYHSQIYLLDEAGENLVLTVGSGDAGRQMRERGHQIPLQRLNSLVARCAREGRGVISNDVTQEPDFLPNQFLPETRAEMALPMIVGTRLIGVLDAQAS